MSTAEGGDHCPMLYFYFIQLDHQVGQFRFVEEDHIPNVHWYYDHKCREVQGALVMAVVPWFGLIAKHHDAGI